MKLNDVTPEAYMCGSCGCGCPAVFETDRGTYVIIGKNRQRMKFSPMACMKLR